MVKIVVSLGATVLFFGTAYAWTLVALRRLEEVLHD